MKKPEHFLVIDIGNSLIKLAVFRGEEMVFRKTYDTLLVKDLKKLKAKYSFKHAIYASVRDKSPGFLRYLSNNLTVLEFNHRLPVPVRNDYGTPKTLGMDRLASVIGAHVKHPGRNVLVIDLGTCIKYDFISEAAVYEGGNIAPGLQMRLLSMHKMTGKLPLVKARFNTGMIGKSTKEALQNGAVWGIKLEIEHFIKTLTAQKGELDVILSGGDSKYFGEILESRIFVLPDLVLFGLNETLKYNLRKSEN